MTDLIEALTLASKYIKPGDYAEKRPTICEHATMYLTVFDCDLWKTVPDEEKLRFKELGFNWAADVEALMSVRFGGCR